MISRSVTTLFFGTVVLTLLIGLGLQGWLAHGSTLLLSLAETGLAYCF